MKTLIVMAAFFTSLSRLFGDGDKPAYEIDDIYTSMRDQVLKIDDKKIPALKGKKVWAVLMEFGYPEAAVTLVAVAEGTTSLYFSNGGGTIGAGEHAAVNKASLEFIKEAEKHLTSMKKTAKFPYVKSGITTFYVLTSDGILTYTAKTNDLGEGKNKLSSIFHSGHEVIGQIRIASPKK